MMKYFEKILVPVDFSVNTQVAISKAVSLSVPGITNIVLVHITGNYNEHRQALQTLATDIINNDHIDTWPYIVNGSNIETQLIEFTRAHKPDLVIIGKNRYNNLFPFFNTIVSSNIAEGTKCPVLTVKPGCLKKKMETVVMPLCDRFPAKKMDVLASLSYKQNITVHLLSILDHYNRPDNHSASVLLQAMKFIKERLQCSVQHSVIHSGSKAMATFRYAEKVKADVLLLNGDSDSTVTTWMHKKDISEIIKPASQLQVLSVKPN